MSVIDRATPGKRRRVVMLVVSNFPRDNRVHKSARSVAKLGHKVTVVWTHPTLKRRVVTEHGTFRSIGVPLDYSNRRRVSQEISARKPRTIPILSAEGGWPWLRIFAHSTVGLINRRVVDLHRRRLSGSKNARALHRATVKDIHDALLPEIFANNPEILHVQDIQPLTVAFVARLAYRESVGNPLRVIYDAHEYVAGQVTSGAHSASLWEADQRKCIKEVDSVSTVCDPIAEKLCADYSLNVQPLTILNVPDLQLAGEVKTVREVCGLANDVQLVVYSGSIAPQRGVATVIEAVAKMPEVHLAVICVPNTRTANAKQMSEMARNFRASDRIHLVEPVDPNNVVEFLRGADVGAHPLVSGPINHELALPNKLFDYIHAGLTLCVSSVTTMSRFVIDNKLGTVFTSGSVEDCRAALASALAGRRSNRFETLGEGALAQYTWDSQEEKFEMLYSRIRL